MSDRTSAALAGAIFKSLAESHETTNGPMVQRAARMAWAAMWAHGGDFQPYQMNCDESLESLGLMRRVDGDDDEEAVYADHEGCLP